MKLNDTRSLLAFLNSRKSASAKAMGEPGPSPEHVTEILRLAVRVPDHGKLSPWRFVVFSGEARLKVGVHFRARWAELNPEHSSETLDFQERLFCRAPTVIAVISTAAEHPKIPIWEQQLSAAAVCFNLVIASQAMGFDAQWQTDWVAYDVATLAAIGLTPTEKMAGLIYLGTSTLPLEDRPRPDVSSITSHWTD